MKKIIISENEKLAILESHNKLRDVLMGHLFDKELVSEQAPVNPQGNDILTMAKEQCSKLKGSTLVSKKNALGQPTNALSMRAPADVPNPIRTGEFMVKTGDILFYYPDMTWEAYYTPQGGTETLRSSSVWACKALNVEQADIEKRISALKAKGYKTYDELSDGDKQVIQTTPNLFSKIVVGKKELYFPKTAGTAELGDTQIKYLEQYTGGKFQQDFITEKQRADAPEKYARWIKLTVPKGNVFAADVILYRNPNNDKVAAIIQQRQGNIQAQKISERDCMDTIKTWYEAWKTGTSISEVEQTEKMDVQKCSRMYSTGYYNYNRDVRNILMALGGLSQGPEYPAVPQYGEEAIFRIPFKQRASK
jgi:hypothetical protein